MLFELARKYEEYLVEYIVYSGLTVQTNYSQSLTIHLLTELILCPGWRCRSSCHHEETGVGECWDWVSSGGEGPLYMSRPPRYPEIIRLTLPWSWDPYPQHPATSPVTPILRASVFLYPGVKCYTSHRILIIGVYLYEKVWSAPGGLYLVFCIYFLCLCWCEFL